MIKKKYLPYFIIIAFLLGTFCSEIYFPQKIDTTGVKLCFTPTQRCTNFIINYIDKAEKEILVQAYSFTSKPIADALVSAKVRGARVIIILDKSNKSSKYSAMTEMIENNIPVYIDQVKGIAHNKVMILDEKTVITGSFNFSHAADRLNAENVLVLQDKEVALQYKKNWLYRQSNADLQP